MMAFTTSPAPRYSSQDAKYRVSTPEKARIESGEYGGITTSIKDSIQESMPVTGRQQTPQQLAGIEKEEEIAGETKYYRGGTEITKQEYEASLLTDTDKSELTTRIGELQAQAKVADELLQGTYQGEKLDPNIAVMDTAGIQRERDSALAKIEVLKGYLEAGQKVPDELKVVISKEVSPVVTFNADGSYGIDVLTGVRNNVPTEILLKIGASQEDIDSAKALNSLQKYKTDTGYDLVKAIDSGDIDLVRKAGFRKDAIVDAQIATAEKRETEKQKSQVVEKGEVTLTQIKPVGRVGGREITELDDYAVAGGYDIARYLRDNDNSKSAKEYLSSLNIDDSDIKEASDYNNLAWNRTTNTDKINEAFVKAGGDLTGMQSPEELDKVLKENPQLLEMIATEPKLKGEKPDVSLNTFIQYFVAARENLPTYQSITNKEARMAVLKDMAVREYMRLYGKGTTLASEGTDLLTFVAPAARALHPEYTFRDIKGTEWAITGANVVLFAVSPILGKVASKAATALAGGLQKAAVLVYPVTTAIDAKNMKKGELIFSIAVDTALTAAIFGKPIVTAFKNAAPGLGLSNRIESLAKAVRSKNATKVWQSADKLEKYGEALERAGIKDGIKLKNYGLFIKQNASAIATNTSRTLPQSFEVLVKDLENIDNSFSLLRQKGSWQIDPRTGKVVDDFGRELTPERQMEEIRTKQTRTILAERLSTQDRALLKKEYGLTDAEIDNLEYLYNGEIGIIREKAAKLAQNKRLKKMFDDINDDIELREEKTLTQIEEESLIEKGAVEEAATRAAPAETYITIEEQDAIQRAWQTHLDDLAQAEVLNNQLATYRALFPLRKLAPDIETLQLVQPEVLQKALVWEDGEVKVKLITPTIPQFGVVVISESENEIETYNKRIAELSTKMTTSQATKLAAEELLENKTEVKEQISTLTKPETKLKTDTKTQTETKTKTEVKPATQTQVETATLTQTKPITTTKFTTETATETGEEKKGRPPARTRLDDELEDEKLEEVIGYSAIGWKQGALKRRGELKRQFIIIRSPFKSEADVEYIYGKPPKNVKIVDGIGSAYKSIKAITGKPPDFILTLDMGIQDVKISSKGRKVSLKFKQDVKQKTTSDINLAKVRT